MRIAYVHTTDFSKRSTSETFVFYNALSLSKYSEVHLVVRNTSVQKIQDIIRAKFGIEIPASLHIHALNKSSFSFYWTALGIIKKLKSKDSIVITRKHGLLPYLFLSGMLNRTLVFFETHDFFFDLTIRPDISKYKRWKQSMTERLLFNKLSGLICLSQSQAVLYKKYLPTKPIIIFPTGLLSIHRDSSERKKKLIYIGSLDAIKGIDHIVALATNLPNTIEVIIASGKSVGETKKFKQKLIDLKLENVKITGWLNKDELSSLLLTCTLGLLPLQDTFFNRYLTVPLKLFDYYAHGLPALCSDFESLRELVESGKTGDFVDWSNTEAVLSKINYYLQPKVSDKLREDVYTIAEKMTWDLRATNQINYFTAIIKKHDTIH